MKLIELIKAFSGRMSPRQLAPLVRHKLIDGPESIEHKERSIPETEPSERIIENIRNNRQYSAIKDIKWGVELHEPMINEVASAAINYGQAGALDALAKRYPTTLTHDVISQQIGSKNLPGLHYELLEFSAEQKLFSDALCTLLKPVPTKNEHTILPEDTAIISSFANSVREGDTVFVAVRSDEKHAGYTSFFKLSREGQKLLVDPKNSTPDTDKILTEFCF